MEINSLNNLAAHQLAQNNHGAALECYQEALTKLRGLVAPPTTAEDHQEAIMSDSDGAEHGHEQPKHCSHCESSTAFQEPCYYNQATKVIGSASTQSLKELENLTDGSTFAFYNRVFTFPSSEQTQCGCPLSQKSQNVMLAVLLYNMGNAHHQLAIKLGESSRLSRAMRLYHLSFSTLENLTEDSDFEEALLLLLCGLYNNMGHISAFFYNRQETTYCLEWLQTIIHSEEFTPDIMCEEDYNFFFQYLLIRSDEQFCIAPAA